VNLERKGKNELFKIGTTKKGRGESTSRSELEECAKNPSRKNLRTGSEETGERKTWQNAR